MRKVLIVTRNFPPLIGGMERLLLHVYQALANDFGLALLGPLGCTDYLPRHGECVELAPKPIARFLLQARLAAPRLARRFKPDLVIAGSGLTLHASRAAARARGIPLAVLVHGLDLLHPNPVYRRLALPALVRAEQVIANSDNTRRLAVRVGVERQRVVVLNPGVTVSGELPSARTARAALGLDGWPILLSVGRLTARKGLPEFLDRSLPAIAARHPKVEVLVVGEAPRAAASHTGGVRRRISEVLRRRGLESRVRLAGAVDDRRLAMAFASADIFLFPVLDQPGDVEGFGMVALEAAAHGVPTVAFRSGGVPDAVSEGASGRLVEPGQYGCYADAVLAQLQEDREATRRSCRNFAARHSWEQFGQTLREICDRLTDGQRPTSGP